MRAASASDYVTQLADAYVHAAIGKIVDPALSIALVEAAPSKLALSSVGN